MKDNALAEWYRTHNYDLRSEIYITLKKIKKIEMRLKNDKMDSRI